MLNEDQLQSLFHELMVEHHIVNAHKGIHKFFVILRLNAAAELLQEGYSVGETAEKLGFSSQSYLSSAYRREFGVWPTERDSSK